MKIFGAFIFLLGAATILTCAAIIFVVIANEGDSTWVVFSFVLALLGLMFTNIGRQLHRGKERPGGGLFPPIVLLISGTAFVVFPIVIFFIEGQFERVSYVLVSAGVGCVLLAISRMEQEK